MHGESGRKQFIHRCLPGIVLSVFAVEQNFVRGFFQIVFFESRMSQDICQQFDHRRIAFCRGNQRQRRLLFCNLRSQHAAQPGNFFFNGHAIALFCSE